MHPPQSNDLMQQA